MIRERISLTDSRLCALISVLMILAVALAYFTGTDTVKALVLSRTVFAVVVWLMAAAIMAGKKPPLFTVCVFWAITCQLTSAVWSLCNYLLLDDDLSLQLVEAISVAGCLLFMFTASYGTLDSLVDDGTGKFLKYRIAAGTAALVSLIICGWVCLQCRFLYVIPLGISDALLIYISVKHLVIPDVEDGFIRPLRLYYVAALCFAVCVLGSIICINYPHAVMWVSGCKLLNMLVSVWIMPLAGKAVETWR